MAIYVKADDAAALRKEYTALHHWNKPICQILYLLTQHVSNYYNKDVVITAIDRDQKTEDKLYEKEDKGSNRKRKTAHGVMAAVDIRSHAYTDKEIKEICSFLNKYNSSNENPVKGGNTALYHKLAGNASHIHIQYVHNTQKN